MGKKNKGKDIRRTLIDETREEYSPFSKVVLKPKEEKKTAPSNKKPGEIVKGYNPSLSFADILSSYEKTGDPYRMPKKSQSSSSLSFGDILDEWENGGKKEKKKVERKENLSSYKATRSFASILNEYEGIYREEQKTKTKSDAVKAKAEVDEAIRTSTMFLDDDDETVPSNVSWSVKGGKNANYVRKEETKEEKEYRRASKEYSPSSSFSSILEEYEKGKIKKVQTLEHEEKKRVEPVIEETDFFLKDDDVEVPSNVSWSVKGGKNENYVREEEKKEEELVKEEMRYKRASKEYLPSSSFSSILEEYEKKKIKESEKSEGVEEKRVEPVIEETDFFLKDDEVEVPSNVSWSVKGGKNENYVREEKKIEEEVVKETVTEKRTASQYSPSLSFSSILSSYEKEKKRNGHNSSSSEEKTFSQIIEEKGDNRKKKSSFTINELRRMNVQATLDLHGETQKDSSELILSFLSDSVSNGLRKVSIITGKGLHSENGNSVLRDLTLSILLSSPLVQETSQAPLTKGGSGAIWIILKEKSE